MSDDAVSDVELCLKGLLTDDQLALRCNGCNMLAQAEGFDLNQVVLEIRRRGLNHLPDCPHYEATPWNE